MKAPLADQGSPRLRNLTPQTDLAVNGTPLSITIESGIACGVHQTSETHVSGSVSNGNGSLSSSVSWTAGFSLLWDDGTERPHSFPGKGIFLRDGHRVSLIHVASPKNAGWVYLVNHNTRETMDAIGTPAKFVYALGIVRKFGVFLPILACIGISLATANAPDFEEASGSLMLMVVGGTLILKTIQRIRANAAWKSGILPRVRQLAESLLTTRSARLPAIPQSVNLMG